MTQNGKQRKTNRPHAGDRRFPGPAGPPPGIQAPPGQVRASNVAPPPPGGFPPPQQAAGPPIEAMVAEFEATVASNQAKFQEMIAQGTQPDPFYLVHARINHLIDAIAQATGPNGPRWAVMTRLGFEKQVERELNEAAPAARRMQLAEGARYTPQMIRSLALQTGTLRRPQ